MDNPQAHEQLLGEIANGEILWHYTDWAGCAGVLGLADKPAALWLTDYRYLNDELEVQWALDLFHHALNGKPADPVPPCERSWQGAQTTSYVACFCRTPDQLSQWRAYSLADPRFALAVRRKALEALGKEFGATVEAVTYTEIGDKKIDEIAEPVIAATQELRALPDSRSNAEPRFREVEGARAKRYHGYLHALEQLSRIAPAVKHFGFMEETEERLIYQPRFAAGALAKPSVHRRQAGTMLVPYVSIPIPDPASLIAAVMVGPGRHVDLTVQALRSALNPLVAGVRTGDKALPIEVMRSRIPYRVR